MGAFVVLAVSVGFGLVVVVNPFALYDMTWEQIISAMVTGVCVPVVLQFLKWLEHKIRKLPSSVNGWLDIYAIPAALVLSIIIPLVGQFMQAMPVPDPLLLKGVLMIIAWAISMAGYDVVKAVKQTGGGFGR
jgi:uncharacterized protein YacL